MAESREEVEALLAADQKEYLEVSKRKTRLKRRIQDRVKQLDKLSGKNVFINPHIKLIHRDVDLCVDFIRKNTIVTSTDIIEYLNKELVGKEKRWPENKPLDGNYFMGRVGVKLKEHPQIRFEKGQGRNGRATTIWEIR